MSEWRFRSIFFDKGREFDLKMEELTKEAQKDGFDFHDIRMAQSSASGTGMSVVMVFRKVSDG
jgi:hypothetical protein